MIPEAKILKLHVRLKNMIGPARVNTVKDME